MPELEPVSLEDRLIGNIRDELEAQNALQELSLDAQTLDKLAWAVAANLHYAFDVAWAPKWAHDVHSWSEPDEGLPTGESHFSECLRCGWLTGHNPTREQALAEYAGHVSTHHPSPEVRA
ncbi:hypothetical protein [Nonomuraea sp. NPDC048826]|uniref:hypothetical protein n=1 Tax=Nonomuraea sp. NPDC048826 TaxID=3364347 RepID=UPI003716144F